MLISDLDAEGRKAIGTVLRERAELEGVSQFALGAQCDCDERTIRKIYDGEAIRSSSKVIKICEFLKLDYDQLVKSVLPEENTTSLFGGYNRSQVEPYIGRYVAVHRSYIYEDRFIGSVFNIVWDTNLQQLKFQQENRYTSSKGQKIDHSQKGDVYFSAHIGLLHILTIFQGAVRLITLGKMQLGEGVMFGAVLSQADRAQFYQPAVSPICFIKISTENEVFVSRMCGAIGPDHEDYKNVVGYVDRAQEQILGIRNL